MNFNREQYEETHTIFESRWGVLTYAGLSREEKGYLALWWLTGEVANGSFDQFFTNSSGNMLPEALMALEELGAIRTLKILRNAVAIFDSVGGYSSDRNEREKRLDLLPEEERHRIFDCESRALEDVEEECLWMASVRLRKMYEQMEIAR